jgi:D-erythronate 2-dehydrogenase
MRVVVTGAAGFVGDGLARHLCANRDALGRPVSKLILTDLAKERDGAEPGNDGFLEWHPGDLSDPALLDVLLGEPIDCLFHLASVPGSLAEREPDIGRSANLVAPLRLAERLSSQGRKRGLVPRVVFASTIAVYGPLGAVPVTEDQPPCPVTSYGAHKLMTEILLADLSRRGEIDARSLRLPGIVVRPIAESGHGSAFMSLLFHKAKAGEPYVCPVSSDASAWWMSLKCCVANLVHAATLPAAALPPTRSCQLPVLHAEVREIVAALARRFGSSATAGFSYRPDAAIEATFGRFPALAAPFSERLGFRSDGSVEELVANAFTCPVGCS